MEQGLVGTWIVKDMSRFGRDYLLVGQYTEIVFPSYDVRFIAVNDGVDSARGTDDFTPIRNVFNDFYAKDTSKKVRAILKARGTSGKHLGNPPYAVNNPHQDISEFDGKAQKKIIGYREKLVTSHTRNNKSALMERRVR